MDQTARVINIEKFRQKRTSLLVATDAVARGIDIPLLDNVINYNFPDKPKLFLHRVGERLNYVFLLTITDRCQMPGFGAQLYDDGAIEVAGLNKDC